MHKETGEDKHIRRKYVINQKCDKCETEFVAYNTEAKLCKECKEEALAELDRNSDECLSCQ
jgi:uncharacterized Zn ribbon protein